MELRAAIELHDNDYDYLLHAYEKRTGQCWTELADIKLPCPPPISVVIAARNVSYSIGLVLDSLMHSKRTVKLEIIVVDDCSSDATASIARMHPLRPKVIVLPSQKGRSIARNVGTAVAKGETILYLDADIVVPKHVIHEHAFRAADELILIGFREGIRLGDPRLPVNGQALVVEPDIEADFRASWHPNAGPIMNSSLVSGKKEPFRLLDDTHDLRKLGRGANYHGWDLAHTVTGFMVSMPRAAVISVGGFDTGFVGWGQEDTRLGAKLIAAGLKVVPLRSTIGFHIDPPDADEQLRIKLAEWPHNIELYRQRLAEPAPSNLANCFMKEVDEILKISKVYSYIR
jgi:glycosyltransferase involved in cell wall biosynthesis